MILGVGAVDDEDDIELCREDKADGEGGPERAESAGNCCWEKIKGAGELLPTRPNREDERGPWHPVSSACGTT